MTREEAILILEEEAEFLYGGDEPYNKIAFEMAIEALKADAEDTQTEERARFVAKETEIAHIEARLENAEKRLQGACVANFIAEQLERLKDMTDEERLKLLQTMFPSADAEFTDLPSYAEYTDLPDIPRYYYEKVVGKMAHEINMLKEQLESADAEQGWIPCSERLPEDSGDYLVCPSDGVIEDYSDCRDVMIIPYDADCEAFGWWTERYDPISLGFVDCDFDEFEVLAWMPLPKPYKGRNE